MGVDEVVSSQVAYHLKVSFNNTEQTHSVILIGDLTFIYSYQFSMDFQNWTKWSVGQVNEKYYQL